MRITLRDHLPSNQQGLEFSWNPHKWIPKIQHLFVFHPSVQILYIWVCHSSKFVFQIPLVTSILNPSQFGQNLKPSPLCFGSRVLSSPIGYWLWFYLKLFESPLNQESSTSLIIRVSFAAKYALTRQCLLCCIFACWPPFLNISPKPGHFQNDLFPFLILSCWSHRQRPCKIWYRE